MTDEEKRLKEIEYLLYLKNKLIRDTKKEIKSLQQEKDMIYGYRHIEREEQKIRTRKHINYEED